MSEEVTVDVTRADSETVVSIGGEINMSSSPQLRRSLLQVTGEGPARLVVDLSGVTYIDTSGMATLVEALQRTRDRGGRLALRGLRAKIRAVFRLARLDEVFPIDDAAD